MSRDLSTYPRESTLLELFAARAEAGPELVAAEQDGRLLTYGELDARSLALALQLRRKGLLPGQMVGLCLDRGFDLLVAILAIVRAGAAYVPLDASFPRKRLASMVADSGMPLLLAGDAQAPLLAKLGAAVLHFSRLEAEAAASPPGEEGLGPDVPVFPLSAAYMIFTSGSTGRPKGVVATHRGVLRLVCGTSLLSLGEGDVIAQISNPTFDAFTLEFWGALLHGGRLLLIDTATLVEPRAFAAAIADRDIALIPLTAVMLSQMMADEPRAFTRVRYLFSGGEVTEKAAFRRALENPPAHLKNVYGPTECTCLATAHEILTIPEGDAPVPIGRAISHTEAHVLGADGREAAVGEAGELYLGGDGLAWGYWRRPALTAQAFLPHAFADTPGARLYRTGDLARRLPAGELEFLGRRDSQVKIRGFRVELGEIEAVLGRHPAVREKIAITRGEGMARMLLAFVVVEAGFSNISAELLQAFCRRHLPAHAVPRIYLLDAMPWNAAGKIDRAALPVPMAEHAPPRTAMETLVAEIWEELLGREPIGVGEDFFALGGHSLLTGRVTTRLRQRLEIEIPLNLIFEYPTVETLAHELEELLAGRGEEGLPPILRTPRDGRPLPLSYPQERVWFLQELEPDSRAYNFQITLAIEGPLDADVLEKVLNEIVRRHEIFRTRFPAALGKPSMMIEDEYQVALPETDLRHLPEALREETVSRILREETAKSFDLTRLPLIRWRLLRLREESFLLVQVEHHFVHDGWSFGVLLGEIKSLYQAFAAGQPSPLPELEVQYADFAAWQRQTLAGERLARLTEASKHRLAGMPMVLDLPTDHPRPKGKSSRGDAEIVWLEPALYGALREFSQAQGVTLFMTMLAALSALLYRYSGQNDFGIGSGVANRRQKAQESLIGMMVNTVVMRCQVRGEMSFAQLLQHTRQAALEAYALQDMPFEHLVRELKPERQVGRNPVVQVLFSFHDAPTPLLEFAGLEASYRLRTNETAKTDLNIIVAPRDAQWIGTATDESLQEEALAEMVWEYDRDLFEPATIRRLIGHYQVLLADAIAAPQKKIGQLALFGAAELARLEGAAYLPSGCAPGPPLAARFADVAARFPQAEALRAAGRSLTYGELDRQSTRVAGALAARGIRPGDLVGLAVARGFHLAIGMLGILKAGAAYVPLDTSYPAERLAFLIADTAMPLVLSEEGLAAQLPKTLPRLLLDAEILGAAAAEASAAADFTPPAIDDGFPAYVIYTSGSTGKPKGVWVPQAAVARLVLGANYLQLAPGDRLGQASSPSFDAATFEIWAPLLNGGTVVTIEKEILLSPPALEDFLEREKIASLFITTALFHTLAEQKPELPARLEALLFGGERCDPAQVRRAFARRSPTAPGTGIVHVYGPTECTTFATAFHLREIPGDVVPIGGPISGTEARVLDRDGHLCPSGVPGELCLGGDGLALGYFGRPALTAEKFVPNPYARKPGERLYRSGDLVRWNRHLELEFLGRVDHQVKLRGFRIELGEIEAALASHPLVLATVVLLREDRPGEKRLVAYATPAQGAKLRAEDLQLHLRQRLPDFMLPAAILVLEAMPLNANGKIDRPALPPPEQYHPAGELAQAATEAEEALCALWREVLGLKQISVVDDFFALGGHSLLATQLLSRLEADFGVRLGLVEVFENATVRQLALLLEGQRRTTSQPIVRRSNARLSELQEPVADAASLDDDSLDDLLRSYRN